MTCATRVAGKRALLSISRNGRCLEALLSYLSRPLFKFRLRITFFHSMNVMSEMILEEIHVKRSLMSMVA